MKKQTKLTIFGLGATLLFATTIGANYALNNTTIGNVNGADETNEYTLTLNKDTSDAFKTGWNGEIFTVNTTLGNPIRFRRVTADSKGNVSSPVANTSDGLDMVFKASSTQAYLFSLDPIQNLTSVKPTFSRIGQGSLPMVQFYRSNEVFTEKTAELQNSSSMSIRSGTSRNSNLGEGTFLAFKFALSGSTSIIINFSSIELTYTCA